MLGFFYLNKNRVFPLLVGLIYALIVFVFRGYEYGFNAAFSVLIALCLVWSGDYLLESGYGKSSYQLPGYILIFAGWLILLMPGIVYMINNFKG